MHKVEKAKLGPALLDEMQRQREALASEVYGLDAVREACTKAAAEGFSGCLVKPPRPVNLKGTAAVKALEAWLKMQGVAFTWGIRRDTPDGPEYPALTVEWAGVAQALPLPHTSL
jgi:hypothetical protein